MFLLIVIVAFIFWFIFSNIRKLNLELNNFRESSRVTGNLETKLVKTLLNLDKEKLTELFSLYKKEFGAGAANYAKKTYQKWKAGEVQPNNHTYHRLLITLPKIMDYDLKCEVLRCFMEEYCSKQNYELSVYTDNWEDSLTPLVKELINKPYSAEIPKEVSKKLHWLSNGEMLIAQDLLRKSQVEESKIAVSMLKDEFANIENLLEKTDNQSKIHHTLNFPYGTITVKIKRR
jgi:hypothetical protein